LSKDYAYNDKWFELKEHYPHIFTSDTYARYLIPHARLNERNKLTDEKEIPGYDFQYQSAYHFDTGLLSKFFKEYAEFRNVKFIDDLYEESVLDSDGNIEKIMCKNNEIYADLFYDCSGFKSLLLEKVMNSEYIDFNETLINDRVIRAKIPYTNKKEQLKNYTNCIALDNGWCWEIPLWDCLSIGYVHSLKFASEKEVMKEFIQKCNKHGVDKVETSIINYKTGRHKKGWVKNVIGVGLAYGFLEPLESTGILTLLINSFKSLELISKRNLFYTNVDRDVFNISVAKEMDNLRGFVELHYAYSSRDDSDYWRYVTDGVPYSMDTNSTYYTSLYLSSIERKYSLPGTSPGLPFIMGGMNYSTFSPAFTHIESETEELIQRKNTFLKEDKKYYNLIEKYPSSMEFLQEKIYRK
jgi:tryptophan halogenase